jgi:16S rRNA (guanine527-N7)-methyltransferase
MENSELDTLKAGAEQLGLDLSESQIDRFSQLHELLKKWSAKINLTAFKSERDFVLFHYLDSLALAKFIGPESFWLDVGTGAGFPGLPCKIVRPDSRAMVIDKNQKKITFVKEAIRILSLNNIEALKQDADIDGFRNILAGKLDLVVSRALSEPSYAFDICFKYVKKGGVLCLMLTESQRKNLKTLLAIASEHRFIPGDEFSYSFDGFNESRFVLPLIKH